MRRGCGSIMSASTAPSRSAGGGRSCRLKRCFGLNAAHEPPFSEGYRRMGARPTRSLCLPAVWREGGGWCFVQRRRCAGKRFQPLPLAGGAGPRACLPRARRSRLGAAGKGEGAGVALAAAGALYTDHTLPDVPVAVRLRNTPVSTGIWKGEDAGLLSKDRQLAGDRMPPISANGNGEDFADELDHAVSYFRIEMGWKGFEQRVILARSCHLECPLFGVPTGVATDQTTHGPTVCRG